MPSADDRVVSMQFDNQAFESRIATTVSSLDKLQVSLEAASKNRGLDNLSTAGSNFHLEGIATAIDTVASKFTTMGAIAFTVLQNITNRAVDAGISLAKSLSLDQVMGGFQEYETNMNSIQTILANTKSDGSTLDDVNGALDQLNEYSDKTIYNFSEMARNIGTFTAAGVNLEDSVNGIKGIANLAAISGSNSQQASTAMYQLSQALAAGKVNLMDWNSVVNAGMGGKVFKEALFETGKAMGTITDVPLSASFDEWEKKGGTFREQMEKGWLTADVLKTTLGAFSGELDASTLKMMGFSDAAATQMVELGQLGIESATQVKTLTQLLGTVKESVGSGWSASFRIIFGNFEEARTLFTDANTAIGKIVSTSADHRNEILQGWKDLGGRTALIGAIKNTFEGLSGILNTIKEAFNDIFPPMTATRLVNLTAALRRFTENLKLSDDTLFKVKRIFQGLFAALSIGIEVVKNVFRVFKDLFGQFTDANGGEILNYLSRLGLSIVQLKKDLVDNGGITKFFDNLGETIGQIRDKLKTFFDGLTFQNVGQRIVDLFDGVKESFKNVFDFETPEALTNLSDRIKERFGFVKEAADKVREGFGLLVEKYDVLKTKLGDFGQFLKDTFGNLPGKIAEIFGDTDYDTALDTVNTGLFAGIVLMVRNFINNGIPDVSGVFDGIKDALNELTGVLESMQQKLKAEALLAIAKALGVLTLSVLVLSLIDSGALTKSMLALSVGFGALVGAMAALNKIVSGPKDAAKLSTVATGLLLLAGAMLVLSVAAKLMSTMSWEELAKGLLGVAVLLGVVVIALKNMPKYDKLVRTGLGLIEIGLALNLMGAAMKIMATMNWEELGKGLVGLAGGLAAIVIALNNMPEKTKMVATGLGLLLLGVALNAIASAALIFNTMSWGEMARGIGGIGAALIVIAGALELMPNGIVLAFQGAGLLMLGAGLLSISTAVKNMSGLSWEELAKGLTGLAGVLLILAGAMFIMEATLGGALAITIVSLSLGQLAKALKAFGSLSWKELLFGLGALAAVFVVLGLATLIMTPIIPAMIALGIAMTALGLGFALFGAGAFLVATAIGVLAAAGSTGIGVLITVITEIIKLIPPFIASLGEGMIQLVKMIVAALPDILTALGKVIGAILDLIIENAPKVGEAVVVIIATILKTLRDAFPDIVQTGFELLLELLRGIKDNIGEIATNVGTIVVTFLDKMTEFFPDIVAKGFELLLQFLKGILDNIEEVTNTVVDIVLKFLESVTARLGEIIAAGAELLSEFLKGIANNIGTVASSAADVIVAFINAISDNLWKIIQAGFDLITDMIKGVTNGLDDVITAGVDALEAFLEGLAKNIVRIVDAGFDFVIQLMNGIADSIDKHAEEFRHAGIRIAEAIMSGLTFGLSDALPSLNGEVLDLGDAAIQSMKKSQGIKSPSTVWRGIGHHMVEGLRLGLANNGSVSKEIDGMGDGVVGALDRTATYVNKAMSDLGLIQPTITPVLDLSNIRAGATQLNGILGRSSALATSVSLDNATILAGNIQNGSDSTLDPANAEPKVIKFEQNNYSPEALSPADIYRQTRNQIAMAKGELALV